jgi:CHAD domain-containing protein
MRTFGEVPVNSSPQELTVTIECVTAASERNQRSAVVLRANGGFILPPLDGTPLDERVFTATHYDTPRRRLERAGIALRRRMENGNNVWELDLPGEPERRLVDAAGGPAAPPAVLGKLLSGLVQSEPLQEMRTVRTRRRGVRVTEADVETVEILVDLKAVLDGRRVEREFTEISLRPLDGDNRPVRELTKQLRRAGAERVREGERHDDTTTPGAAAVKAMVHRQHARMLAHDPGVRLGDDPEDIHQLRVATRRLRAVLRSARRFFPGETADVVRRELAWLSGLLGAVRDLDVLIERVRDERPELDLPAQTEAAHVVDLLVADREAARGRLLNTMRTKRYLRLLARVEELAEGPPTATDDIPVGKLARVEFKKLRAAASSLGPEATDEELHKVRVRVKRARYAAEVAEAVVGKPASRFVEKAKRLQDVAGELQDAAVAEERLSLVSERVVRPAAAFAAGRLVERAHTRRAAARAAFASAWSKAEKTGLRAWA